MSCIYRLRNVVATLAVACLFYVFCVINSVQNHASTDYTATADGSKPYFSPISYAIDVQKLSTLRKRQVINYTLSNLPERDFHQLINFTHFNFIVNNQRCRNETANNLPKPLTEMDTDSEQTNKVKSDLQDDVYLVIFVHSRPSNFDRRQGEPHSTVACRLTDL